MSGGTKQSRSLWAEKGLANTAEIYQIRSGGRGHEHRSFVQESGGIKPSTWEVQKQSRGDESSCSTWVTGGSPCHGGLRMQKPAGLLKVKSLRITAHTDLALGPRNLQLESAVGQGSVQWEQHLVLSLSVYPSEYLLLAQGAGLGESLVCPSMGAMVPPALAPALYTCVAKYVGSLLPQSTDPGTAIHNFFSLHSHNCRDFGLACRAAARSACSSARRFVLARQR